MAMKSVPKDNPGLKKLPTKVRNKMGYMAKGGYAKEYNKGGAVMKYGKGGYANCGASMKPNGKSKS